MTQLEDPDSGASSICADIEYAPILYHWYPRHDGETPRAAFRQLLSDAGVPVDDADRFTGEMVATMGALRMGRLHPLHGVKGPMRNEKRIQLFEVRHSYLLHVAGSPDRELHIRFYHVEPKKLARKSGGSTVIGLHMHLKDISSDTVDDEQDTEIQAAAQRFYDGLQSWWGLHS